MKVTARPLMSSPERTVTPPTAYPGRARMPSVRRTRDLTIRLSGPTRSANMPCSRNERSPSAVRYTARRRVNDFDVEEFAHAHVKADEDRALRGQLVVRVARVVEPQDARVGNVAGGDGSPGGSQDRRRLLRRRGGGKGAGPQDQDHQANPSRGPCAGVGGPGAVDQGGGRCRPPRESWVVACRLGTGRTGQSCW